MVCWTKFLLKFLLKPVKRIMLSTVVFFVLLMIRKRGLVLIFKTAATSASALISLAVLTSSSFFFFLSSVAFIGSLRSHFVFLASRLTQHWLVSEYFNLEKRCTKLYLTWLLCSRNGYALHYPLALYLDGKKNRMLSLSYLPGLFLFLALGVNFLLHTSCRKLWRS